MFGAMVHIFANSHSGMQAPAVRPFGSLKLLIWNLDGRVLELDLKGERRD
jgi:hypothetical protein